MWPRQCTACSSLLSHFCHSLLGAQSKKSSHAALNSETANAWVSRSPLRKLFVTSRLLLVLYIFHQSQCVETHILLLRGKKALFVDVTMKTIFRTSSFPSVICQQVPCQLLLMTWQKTKEENYVILLKPQITEQSWTRLCEGLLYKLKQVQFSLFFCPHRVYPRDVGRDAGEDGGLLGRVASHTGHKAGYPVDVPTAVHGTVKRATKVALV